METLVLATQSRAQGVKARSIRQSQSIPAVCYGAGMENLHFQMEYQTFRKVYQVAGSNTIIDLQVEGQKQPVKVLVHDLQYHPLYGTITHVDFLRVRMDEKVTTHVPLEFVGQAPAVKELAGVLVTHMDEIEITCLPQYLLHKVEVDISVLADFSKAVHVKDLQGIPSTVQVLDNPDEIVVSVVPPRAEEVETAAPTTVVQAEVEAGAEGAAAPAEGAAAAPAAEKKEEGK